MKNTSSFKREAYLDEVVDAARPIGKDTAFGAVFNHVQKHFMSYPIHMKCDKENHPAVSKTIYRHAEYNDLYYELTQFVALGESIEPHLLTLYDFSNQKMILVNNWQGKELPPLQPQPMNEIVRRRLFEEYALKA